MTIIGDAYVEIRADDKKFAGDVHAAAKKIKDVTVNIKADLDMSRVNKKLRDLRYRLRNDLVMMKADVDLSPAEAKIDEIREKIDKTKAEIDVSAAIEEAAASLEAVSTQAREATIQANADTVKAEALLGFASRNRRSKIFLDIDQQSKAALMGLFSTITGTLPVDKVRGAILSLAGNFETLAIKSGLALTALSALSAVALNSGADLLSVGADILEVANLVSFLPAGIFALISIMKVQKFAWEDFGAAAHDNSEKANEALAKLPPQAQAAALAMRGVRESIQQPVQNAFWEEVGTSLQDMVAKQLPHVQNGLKMTARAWGVFTKQIFDTVRGFDDHNDSWDSLSTGIRNAAEGIGPFIKGIERFVAVGATYLPRFGEWMGDLGEKFGLFAKNAEESGDMVRWMDTGIQRAKELASVVGSTVSVFSGLTKAAKLSGAPGLTEFTEGMKDLATTVNGEPFQSRLITILEGARTGTEKMADGFGRLAEFVGESSESISHFLDLSGEIVELSFDNLIAMFDGTGLGSGLYDALSGLREATELMKPGFRDLGELIGDLGEIAEALFISIAPGFNQIADTLGGVVAGLKDGIIDAMPVFNEFIQNILMAMSGPIVVIAEAIGNLLSAFADLPGAIQTVLMSLGLFLLMKGKMDGFFNGLRDGAVKTRDAFALTAVQSEGIAKQFADSTSEATSRLEGNGTRLRDHWRAIGDQIKVVGATTAAGLEKSFTDSQPVLQRVGDAVAKPFVAAGQVIQDEVFTPIREGVQRDIVEPFQRTAGEIRARMGEARGAFQENVRGMVADAKLMATDIAGNARVGFEMVARETRPMRWAMEDAAQAIGERTVYMQTRFLQAGDVIRNTGDRIAAGASTVATSVSRVATGVGNLATSTANAVGNVVAPVVRRVGDAVTGAATAVNSGMRTIGSGISRAATGFHGNLAPARTAFTDLRSHIGTALDKSVQRISDFGTVAGARAAVVGRTVGTRLSNGLKTGVGDLKDLLGGPWGIALAGATAALGIYAAEHAEAAAKVDELAASLDAQTGAFTGQSKKIVASDILDLDAGMWDDFNRLWYRNMEEIVDISEISMEKVTDAIADPTGRDAYVDNWKAIRDAAGAGTEVSEELAAAVGLSTTALDGLSQTDLNEVTRQIEAAADNANEAETEIRRLAEATGTNDIVAAKLSANYETLASRTSTASDKFSALKENLDLLNGGKMTAVEASRNYEQSLDDIASSVASITEEHGIAAKALVDVNGAFDLTSQAGRDFSKSMEGHADSILQVGTAALQQALTNGKELPEAQAAALAAMEGPMSTLREQLANLGFDSEQINGIMKQLGLDPEKLKGALVVDTAQAEVDVARAALAAQAYANGNYTAVLAALPEDAKAKIGEALGLADEFAAGDYEAIVSAINESGPGIESFLANVLTAVDGDYSAAIKAEDQTGGAVESAKIGLGTVLAPPPVDLTAIDMTAVPVATADATISQLHGITVPLDAENKVTPVMAAAQGIVDSFRGKKVNAEAIEKAQQQVNQAQGIVDSFRGKNVDAKAIEKAQGAVNAAQRMVDSFRGKDVDAVVNDRSTGVVATIKSSISSIVGKTVDVVTNFISRHFGEKANGGIMNGAGQDVFADGGVLDQAGVRAFANGGIMDNIKSYAGGGLENHTAQIARGGWPVRIWAEPETGGEAYIPLSINKRARSIKILEEVMQIFGYGMYKKFADGGILSGLDVGTKSNASSSVYTPTSSASSSSVVSASGRSIDNRPNIHIHPSQGLDEKQIGNIAADRMWLHIQNEAID